MTGYLYIDQTKIGEVDFQVSDESMGGIGGILTPNSSYEQYRPQIQNLYNEKGIANVSDFNFKIVFDSGITSNSQGVIGITDMPGDDEIYVESAGNNADMIKMILR